MKHSENMAQQPSDRIVDVEFTSLVYGGDALARLPDGRVLFVPFALPGEKGRVRIVEERRGYLRGELISISNPAPERIEPRCRHFGICGGCYYQHIAYDRQLEVKRGILEEQLQRLANIQNPPVERMIPSPNAWNYRNTLQFHLDRTGHLGYQRASSHEVVAITECHMPESDLNEIWPKLDTESLPEISRIILRQGQDDDVLLILEGHGQSIPVFSTELSLSSVFIGPSDKVILAGDDHLFIKVNGRLFRVSAGSFFQVNIPVASAMVDYLVKNLPINPNITVMDLYCGVGLFSAFLASKVKKCIGIEVAEEACEDFAFNLDEFNNVELYQGTAGGILPSLSYRPEVIIVDPPRSGLEPVAINSIIGLRPGSLAYVSCDPATLSRDAKRLLAAGYKLTKITPFDMFPQTYHIESISLFTINE